MRPVLLFPGNCGRAELGCVSLSGSEHRLLTVPPRLLQLCPVVDVALGLVNDQLGLVNCKYLVGPTPFPAFPLVPPLLWPCEDCDTIPPAAPQAGRATPPASPHRPQVCPEQAVGTPGSSLTRTCQPRAAAREQCPSMPGGMLSPPHISPFSISNHGQKDPGVHKGGINGVSCKLSPPFAAVARTAR